MSNVSTSHNVVPFVSGKSEALTGQRLTVAKYKSTAKTPAKYPNVCASIPVLEVTDMTLSEFPALMPHFTEWMTQQQDNVFKSVYESHGGILSSINDAELDIPSIIGYFNASSLSGRLTKEAIESWYLNECCGVIYVHAAVKNGFAPADAEEITLTPAQEEQVSKTCNAYRDLFSGLAGGATKYATGVQESLTKMIGYCVESPMTERLLGRLESMKEAKDFADLL